MLLVEGLPSVNTIEGALITPGFRGKPQCWFPPSE
jgi:hypothetical protein